MIRNIFIINNGVPLVTKNFGECQSLGNDNHLISGFIEALFSFSKEIVKSSIQSMNFDEYTFYFYKNPAYEDILYVVVSDRDDEPELMKFKIRKISSIFIEQYTDKLQSFKGDIGIFDGFGDILIEMNIAQKNCGGRPECEGCPNSQKVSKILNFFKKDKKSFLQRLKSFFTRK
ncbi:MAG: hypothetical protein ACTSRP_08115 [Candidatus Helarchaeota archaeon]